MVHSSALESLPNEYAVSLSGLRTGGGGGSPTVRHGWAAEMWQLNAEPGVSALSSGTTLVGQLA